MPRRVRGEGGIYREGNTYVAQFSYVDSKGVRRRPKVRTKTRPEALAQLDELRRQHTGTTPAAVRRASRERLGPFLERWLTLAVESALRPNTVTTYRYQVRHHIAPALGHLPLANVGTEDVQRLLNDLARTYSASTVQQTRRTLRTALEYAVTLGLLPANPVVKARPPQSAARPPRTPTALSAHQVGQLLEATASSRFHALYATTVAVGLRRGEALGLRWSDLDLDARLLHVRGQLQRGAYVPVKTDAASRVVALPSFAQRALLARAAAQAEEAERARRLLGPGGWEDTGYVFTTGRGRPLLVRNVYRRYQADVAAAGFPGLTFHALRHTAISLMAAGGVHQRVVMQVVGHTRASLTTEVYTHASAELQRAAAEIMDLAIGPGKGPGSSAPGHD